MIEVHFLIPVEDNAGKTFDPIFDVVFEQTLIALFGGYSRLPGTVQGGWQHAGVVYADESRVYAVALASITEGGKVRDAVDFAKRHYGQLAIFVRYLGLVEVL